MSNESSWATIRLGTLMNAAMQGTVLRLLARIVAALAALPLAAQEPDNYLAGGDFEDTGAPLAAWRINARNGNVAVNWPAGRWVTVTTERRGS